jgi:hypothetical protein
VILFAGGGVGGSIVESSPQLVTNKVTLDNSNTCNNKSNLFIFSLF